MEELVQNVYTQRMRYFDQLLDPRRNLNADCGYPDTITIDQYHQIAGRNPFAQRALEVMPREAFQTPFTIYETDKKAREKKGSAKKERVEPVEEMSEETQDVGKRPPFEVRNFAGSDAEEETSEKLESDEPTDDPIDENSEESEGTPFEKDVDSLDEQVRGVRSWYGDEEGSVVQTTLMNAAIQAGYGSYGVIVIGLNDGEEDLSQPAKGVEERGSLPRTAVRDEESKRRYDEEETKITANAKGYTPYSLTTNRAKTSSVLTLNAEGQVEEKQGKRQVTFLSVFSELAAPVASWESNRASPRYGQPTSYNVSFDGPWDGHYGNLSSPPSTTVNVHWTRVVHVIGRNKGSSKVSSQPELQSIFNCLMNLDKIFAAGGEGAWKGTFPGVILSTHPELGGNVKVDRADLRNQWENFDNTLSRVMYLMGMSASPLQITLTDLTPHKEMNVEAICVNKGIPKRKFMGSERGELSSSEDEGDWNDKLVMYRNTYLIPDLVVPFYDRLIMLGVLSEPEQYHVEFGDLDAQSAKEKADVSLVYTQAMAAYVAGGVSSLISEEDYLVEICGFDEEKVRAWLERAAVKEEETFAEDEQMAEEWGMEPVAPEGFEKPMDQQLMEKMNGRGSPFPPEKGAVS